MDKIKATLEWYSAQVSDCRKFGAEGDIARSKLDRDGGRKAREALDELFKLKNSA